MPKRKTNSSAGRGVLTVMILALLGVGVFAAYVKMTPSAGHVANELRAEKPSVTREKPAGPSVEVDSSSADELRIPVLHGEDASLDISAGPVPKGVKPMVFIATETLKQLKIPGAKALGVDIKKRNALIDFNEALDKGYGSMEEGQLIKSLQWALGQFPNIDTFQIVIDGQVKDTLGQLDLTDPIPVIRPDGKSTEPDPSTNNEVPPTP